MVRDGAILIIVVLMLAYAGSAIGVSVALWQVQGRGIRMPRELRDLPRHLALQSVAAVSAILVISWIYLS